MYSVEADNLIKRYGSNEALRGVSFRVDAGEIFGIIGPDGAGKTSIFRILTTEEARGYSGRMWCGTIMRYAAVWAICPAVSHSIRTLA